MDRREPVRRSPEVLDRQLEDKRLAVGRFGCLVADLVVVGARFDRLIEDGWIGCQAGDRELLDVALQLTRVEHLSSDVVQPQALSKLLQRRRRFHAVSWWACLTKVSRGSLAHNTKRRSIDTRPVASRFRRPREPRERPAWGQSSRDGQPRLDDAPPIGFVERARRAIVSLRTADDRVAPPEPAEP